MTQEVQKQDERLFRALQSLPNFPFHKFIRLTTDEERRHREQFERYNEVPVFHFSAAFDFDLEAYEYQIRNLRERIADDTDSPLIATLYQQKLNELEERANLIHAVQEQNDAGVSRISTALYGIPRSNAHDYAREFAEMLAETSTFHEHSRPVDAERLKKMIEVLFLHYRLNGWEIHFFDESSLRVKRGSSGGRILIPERLHISRARAARLLIHEIEVHILRAVAASQSPLHLLSRGLDHYLPTEEGLAIWAQMQVAKVAPKHAPGFWDGWACALAQEGGFLHVYHTLREARRAIHAKLNRIDADERAKDAAWRLCLRVYRGIHHPHCARLGYFRDHLYRTGLQRVTEYLDNADNHEQALKDLYIGKLDIDHLPVLKELDIKPSITPDFISRDIVESFF